MGTCKQCDSKTMGIATICKSCKETNLLAKSEKDGTMEDKVGGPTERPRDRIPNVRSLPQVEVFAYQNGRASFRYSVTPPSHAKVAWKKKMSGKDAYHMLIGVKNKNRLGRLESSSLPVE